MQTHDFGATYQEGIVVAVDSTKHKVRCKIPALEDLETAWLPFLTPNAGGNKFYCLPDEGELVALLLDARGEGGCVLGTIYNDKDTTPAGSNDIWKKQFSNGTMIEHDRDSGNITIHATGKVIINGSDVDINQGSVKVAGGAVTVSGGQNVTVSGGTVSVVGGDVVADGISLKNHTHGGISRGGSQTNPPA